jgi:tellurite resistance protein
MNLYRDMRDSFCEQLFKSIYESPWMKVFQPFTSPEDTKAAEAALEEMRRRDADQWRKAMTKGKFPDAVVRILLAIGFADQQIRRKGYELMGRLIDENSRMKDISDKDLQKIVRTQARILQTDTDQAIDTLARLLRTKKDRQRALALIKKAVKLADRQPNPQERIVLDKVTAVLEA